MATTTDSPSADLAGMLDQMMHPYRGKMAEFPRLPATGLGASRSWSDGPYVSRKKRGGKTASLRERFTTETNSTSSSSTAHTRFIRSPTRSIPIFGRAAKFEAEIVSMTAHMLHGDQPVRPWAAKTASAARSRRAVRKASFWR